MNVGWERRTASAGWCLLWSPFAQRKGQERSKSRWASIPSYPYVLCQAFIISRALRPPSGSPSSVGRPTLHRALRLPLGVPPSVGLTVFRWAFCPPSSSQFGDPSSVERSALRWTFRPPSGSPSSVGRSAVRRVLHSAISCPLSVSPSFEQFEDCVLNTPTGYSFNDLSTVSSKRQRGPDSSNMRTVSYISRQDLASRNLRTMSSKSGLISCTLSMSQWHRYSGKLRRDHCHRQQRDLLKNVFLSCTIGKSYNFLRHSQNLSYFKSIPFLFYKKVLFQM